MKKIFAMILILAMLATAAAAIAEGTGNLQSGLPQMQGCPQQGRGPKGGFGQGMPGTSGQEQNDGKPADVPMKGTMGGFGQAMPEMNGQAQKGGKTGDMHSGGRKGAVPGMQSPVMIDFDALAARGVISQETCDKIKSYMEAHEPADLPETNGEKPEDDSAVYDSESVEQNAENEEKHSGLPEMKREKSNKMGNAEMDGLLDDLLKNGIITQGEYEAIVSAN